MVRPDRGRKEDEMVSYKLTGQQIRDIIVDGRPLRHIAADYGVSYQAIQDIKTGESYGEDTREIRLSWELSQLKEVLKLEAEGKAKKSDHNRGVRAIRRLRDIALRDIAEAEDVWG